MLSGWRSRTAVGAGDVTASIVRRGVDARVGVVVAHDSEWGVSAREASAPSRSSRARGPRAAVGAERAVPGDEPVRAGGSGLRHLPDPGPGGDEVGHTPGCCRGAQGEFPGLRRYRPGPAPQYRPGGDVESA